MKPFTLRTLILLTFLAPLAATAAPVGPDSDGDGVRDTDDVCPYTLAGAKVDSYGCAMDQDFDGVPDGLDRCAETPFGATVDPRGCSQAQQSGGGAAAALETPAAPAPQVEEAAPATPTSPSPASAAISDEQRGTEIAPALIESSKPEFVAAPTPPAADAATTTPETSVAAPVAAPPAAALPVPTAPQTVAAPVAPVVQLPRNIEHLYAELLFVSGKAELTADSQRQLAQAAPALARAINAQQSTQRVVVVGHADPLSEAGKAEKLAADRAMMVHAYLIGHGVSPRKIKRINSGDQNPTVEGGDGAANRRTEIFLYPN